MRNKVQQTHFNIWKVDWCLIILGERNWVNRKLRMLNSSIRKGGLYFTGKWRSIFGAVSGEPVYGEPVNGKKPCIQEEGLMDIQLTVTTGWEERFGLWIGKGTGVVFEGHISLGWENGKEQEKYSRLGFMNFSFYQLNWQHEDYRALWVEEWGSVEWREKQAFVWILTILSAHLFRTLCRE